MRINPAVVPTAYANRAFLARATRYLTAEAGLRQFLDIGTGMPAGSNIHDMASMASRRNELIAQQTVPRTRDQVAAFFTGLDLIEPGLVRVPEWRPALAIDAAPAQMWAGVALQP
jgi:hypothetical protein